MWCFLDAFIWKHPREAQEIAVISYYGCHYTIAQRKNSEYVRSRINIPFIMNKKSSNSTVSLYSFSSTSCFWFR
ncbi:hypothetical protein Gasu2_28400 [Galdieria sulphuraria]|nr:hypothetical protein Gasu2_28400 [Galdieria sulphuraria]